MTNIEELRKRFDEKMRIHNEDMWHVVFTNRNGDKLIVEDLFTFIQSEIEAAEKARTEAIIAEIEQRYKDSLGIGENPLVEHLSSKFLNNPK